MVSENTDRKTVEKSAVTDCVSPQNTWQRLRDHLAEVRESLENEAEVYEKPDCPHCDREMEKGSVGGGRITYGCYRDDCPYHDEHGYSYAIKRSTIAAKTERERYQTILDVIQALAREEHDCPHDPETCLRCGESFEDKFQKQYGVCGNCEGVLSS